MSGRYDGPIIDAHHHLWDITLGRHAWLTDDDSPLKSLGDMSFLRRSYLIDDYLNDAGPQKIVGSVYVETGWDRARPVDEEVRWLQTVKRPHGIAAQCVAWAPLRSADAGAALEALAAHGPVVGVRETIRWHPDPAKRWAEAGLLDNVEWRRGAALLPHHGLALELLMNPYQAADVVRLARDMPDLSIIVNHCGTPLDRDAESLARWKAGLRAMGQMPNTAIKLSNFAAYGPDKSLPALRDTIVTCIDAFTPDRAMFATDYPVGRRAMTFQDICERFKDVVEELSACEQRALFHDNARRLYRFD